MRQVFLLMFCTLIFMGCASCKKDDQSSTQNTSDTDNTKTNGSKMKIAIGNSTFTATFEDNATATAFKALLPLTLDMIELNGNEKYGDLSTGLPTNTSHPGSIKNGDIMLYGSNTLVLFYKSFSTSYSYTRIGKIDDVTGLTNALGTGNVKVNFVAE